MPAFVFNSDLAKAYTQRGVFYANRDNLTQALSDYNKALAINPDWCTGL